MKTSRNRTSEPMLQYLESRRLMSSAPTPVTAPQAREFADAPVPHLFVEFFHSSAIEALPAAPDVGGPIAPQNGQAFFPSTGSVPAPFPAISAFRPDDAIPDPDPQALQVQLAHAIATGSEISIVSVAPATKTEPATLSSMYADLPRSTVQEIDSATAKDLVTASSLTTVATLNLTETVIAPASAASLTLVGGATTVSVSMPSQSPDITSDKALVTTLKVVTSPQISLTTLSTASTTTVAPPTWSSLRIIEQEFTAIRSFANQVIAEIAKDSVIALAHLEGAAESGMELVESAATSTGWQYTAFAGAAVAAVALMQNEIKRDKDKPTNIFSIRMIEQVV